jgi:hypothetical protein
LRDVLRLRPFVSPFLRRVLFVVAAAIRLAVAVLRPCFLTDALIFSYCRVRFALFTPLGGIAILPESFVSAPAAGDLRPEILEGLQHIGDESPSRLEFPPKIACNRTAGEAYRLLNRLAHTSAASTD